MARWRPFVQGDSYMANKKWTPLVIGNGYTTVDGASGPAPEYETVTGNPVSFNAITPFPLRKLSIAFSPVQDLNGYDSPWPAGGGKNLANIADRSGITTQTTLASGLTFSAGTYTLSGYLSNSGSASVLFRILKNGSVSSSSAYVDSSTPTRVSVTFTVESTDLVGVAVAGSAAGYNASATKLMIEAGSTMTSYAPYSNICPISGWDSLGVEQRGKNLLNPNSTVEFGACYGNGGNPITRKRMVIRLPSGNYTFTASPKDPSDVNAYIYINTLNADGSYSRFDYFIAGSSTVLPVKRTLTDGQYLVLYDAQATTEQIDAKFDKWNIQLELGWTQTDFVPYNPSSRSISINLGSTVYSGWVDVVTGVGEVTHQKVTLDETGSYYTYTSGGVNSFRTSSNPFVNSNNVMCNLMPPTSSFTTAGIRIMQNNHIVYFVDAPTLFNIGTEVADWKAKLKELREAGTPLEFIAELQTPIPIQLTPQEINSLAGDNTMWTDAQNLEVTYRSN